MPIIQCINEHEMKGKTIKVGTQQRVTSDLAARRVKRGNWAYGEGQAIEGLSGTFTQEELDAMAHSIHKEEKSKVTVEVAQPDPEPEKKSRKSK